MKCPSRRKEITVNKGFQCISIHVTIIYEHQFTNSVKVLTTLSTLRLPYLLAVLSTSKLPKTCEKCFVRYTPDVLEQLNLLNCHGCACVVCYDLTLFSYGKRFFRITQFIGSIEMNCNEL